MKLDLRKEFEEIYSYLVRRVQTFDPSKNNGPGDEKSPVAQIQFGYQCDQAGWVALIFDTRPDAEPDGEWNSYIEENIFERPHWQDAIESLETKAVDCVLLDGSKRKISSEVAEEEYVAIFGELLKAVLMKARQEGVFKALPKANRCHLGVEEHDGGYAWPHYEDRGKDDLL
jgi:hypothetical protein